MCFFIRSFAKPPPPVQTVCECIVVLRGYKEVSWKTAKGMMSETNFLYSLTTLDVDGINQGQVGNMYVNVCICTYVYLVCTVYVYCVHSLSSGLVSERSQVQCQQALLLFS